MQYLTPLSVPVHQHSGRMPKLIITKPTLSKMAICVGVGSIGMYIWQRPDPTFLYVGAILGVILALFSLGGDFAWGDIAELRIRRNMLRKEIEDLRSQRQNRKKETATIEASIAHDIKNPLACISSAIQMIAESPRVADTEKGLAELARSESERLAHMLNNYLQTGSEPMSNTEVVNVVDMVRNVVNVASAHPDRLSSTQLSLDYSTDDLVINGDQEVLHRAVFNLVHNAIQASPENSVVRVDVHPDYECKKLNTGTGAVVIRVSDQGRGVPAEVRDRLFHPFFTTKNGGTGLGLSAVSHAAEVHGGAVEIADPSPRFGRSQKGACFTLYIPLA